MASSPDSDSPCGRERILLRVDGRLFAVRAVVFRRIAAGDAKGIISPEPADEDGLRRHRLEV
jgi:hypothetical protein